ncbi:MAG: phosphate ABC transporter permease PstA [Candidatus Eremiobacteraeota bacterium]|nr:phosphate ABC transporter permease PstA [Candidatus Eremiobacteraeota bacterium]MBV8366720.1 phosphate ABC transporter permease PstA [Candidatus Eremiobacteraeota bacterium]
MDFLKSPGFRKFWNAFMIIIAALCAIVCGVVLAVVVTFVISKGYKALNLDFFTKLPLPVGMTGGGVANAIVGSLEIVLMASVISVPVGVLAGIYLALFGRGHLAANVRFFSDVLTGMPSIAIGVFAYSLVVIPTGHFSAHSAAVALAVIMLPIVVRTTEEAVRLVPGVIREGALALGIPAWKATLLVTVPVARAGIVTGALLAVARVAGESAPLLFTAFGSQYWSKGLSSPTAALPLVIFQYAISPYPDWQQLAWGCALVLVALVFALNLTARLAFSGRVSAN